MNVDLYNKAIDELKNNFNNKYLVILDRNNASIVYKGNVKVEEFEFKDDIDEIVKRIFIFYLENGKKLIFDFEDVIYVKLNQLNEYGLVYSNFLFLINNLNKDSIKSYIEFQNFDLSTNEIEDILYEK
ncbi:hypothetical protein [Sneathia sanguinegens]|uniref:Uncharacterized protein n=1 Tax=Sneathia sanguinegens TaxID=40543 RepID=A0ABT7HJA2_9FUSO|nr:hypothetical protein [Sneathia sanguinegens]MDK9580604.1 hypothetical protein [Sneathia sanguinegens]MDU7496515.1 hypothetical protein [Sneathia sanguinegens]